MKKNDELSAWGIDMLKSGKTVAHVARVLGVDKRVARRWRDKNGIRPTSPGIHKKSKFDHMRPKVIELLKAGYGRRTVSQKTGVPRTTVTRWRRVEGLPNQKPRGSYKPFHEYQFSDGNKPQPREVKAAKEAWKTEWHGVARTECKHWKEHPELVKWKANRYYKLNAKRIYQRIKSKPEQLIRTRYRTRLYYVLKGIKKSAPTLKLLGCSIEFFKAWLESQFKVGMTWDNYGPYWHVDHIRPCASFDLSDPAQQRACAHFSNLQPLEATLNRRKSAKWNPVPIA